MSLFSGAGGLDLGVEAAGFRTMTAVEWDSDAADTMEKNAPRFFPELNEVLRADLYPLAAGSTEGIQTRDIRHAAGLGSRERPDLLVGGPPCVAFSKSGFWLDWKRDGVDPAASLLQAYTRILSELGPATSCSRTSTRLLLTIGRAGPPSNASNKRYPSRTPKFCLRIRRLVQSI